jgi:protein phosphatase
MIRSGSQTAIGARHKINEDAFGMDPKRGLWFVADGMGGHAAGDVASNVVRETVLAEVGLGEPLAAAICKAHESVVATAAGDPEKRGMGSTIIALQVDDTEADIAWVGDSRLYLLRGSELEQLTRDHSYVEYLISQGEITSGEADNHPERNVLVQTLGYDQPNPSSLRMELQSGDRMLLCSDGLYTEVAREMICDVLNEERDPQTAAERLIDQVVAIPGKDDATAIVLDFESAAQRTSASPWKAALIGITAGLIAFIVAILALGD